MHNRLTASIAAALLFASAGANAASLSFNPTASFAAPGAGNPTTPNAAIQIVYDNTGTTADSIEFEVTFDDVDLNVSVAAAAGVSCSATGGVITVIAFDAGSNTIASGNLCALTFTTDTGAANGEVKNLAFQNVVVSDGGGAAVAPTTTPGTITIQTVVANPPVLTFAPASGTIASGGSFTITPSGGQAGGSATYTCSPPAGVTLTNGNGTINTGGSAVTVTPTCPAGNPDGTLSCTHTGGAGSTASPVTYTVDCPAALAPNVTANPAPGALTCNGAAGSTQTTSITFTNSGTANATGFSCTVGGTGFTLQTAPAGTINSGGGSTTATVACTVPADGAPANNGTVNCSGTGVGPFAYTVSSVAQASGGLTQATTVPANSLWSKIGLIGLLAALGMLVVGFRRNH